MSILSQQLAADIYNCHAEIIRSKELLKRVNDFIEQDAGGSREIVQDISRSNRGNYNNLQLGIPSGSNSHNIMYLSPDLGKYIIEAHLAKMKAKLVELSTMATISLSGHKQEPEGQEV